jgi:hypothetical protein
VVVCVGPDALPLLPARGLSGEGESDVPDRLFCRWSCELSALPFGATPCCVAAERCWADDPRDWRACPFFVLLPEGD